MLDIRSGKKKRKCSQTCLHFAWQLCYEWNLFIVFNDLVLEVKKYKVIRFKPKRILTRDLRASMSFFVSSSSYLVVRKDSKFSVTYGNRVS